MEHGVEVAEKSAAVPHNEELKGGLVGDGSGQEERDVGDVGVGGVEDRGLVEEVVGRTGSGWAGRFGLGFL